MKLDSHVLINWEMILDGGGSAPRGTVCRIASWTRLITLKGDTIHVNVNGHTVTPIPENIYNAKLFKLLHEDKS